MKAQEAHHTTLEERQSIGTNFYANDLTLNAERQCLKAHAYRRRCRSALSNIFLA